MQPLSIDILIHTPTASYPCRRCALFWDETAVGRRMHGEDAGNSLPADLREEYEAILEWAGKLASRYRHQIAVRLIDPVSPAGIWRGVRHRIRRYPAVVVGGDTAFPANDPNPAEEEIRRRLA